MACQRQLVTRNSVATRLHLLKNSGLLAGLKKRVQRKHSVTALSSVSAWTGVGEFAFIFQTV